MIKRRIKHNETSAHIESMRYTLAMHLFDIFPTSLLHACDYLIRIV
jgi:hypothetical protein